MTLLPVGQGSRQGKAIVKLKFLAKPKITTYQSLMKEQTLDFVHEYIWLGHAPSINCNFHDNSYHITIYKWYNSWAKKASV